jgi:hypothetical protein
MMMLSDGSGLAFTVREYLSPLGRYDGMEWSDGIVVVITVHTIFII